MILPSAPLARLLLVASGLMLPIGGCSFPKADAPDPRPLVPEAGFEDALLAVHNRERARAGVPPVIWSDDLAARAALYAPTLVTLGRLEHSPKAMRGNEGENLWMGTAGAYRPESMAEGWASERRHFRPGRFPDVSTSGRWADVGHYTQMIWPSTRQVGCALARGKGWDFLVCRYSPPGNVVGRSLP